MTERHDVIIAGGGPAGSTAALTLARAGRRVLLLEKDAHPRFHIGESILPRNTPLLRELGIEERVRALPHLPKFGAEFGLGNDHQTRRFTFNDGLLPGFPVFNIERAHLDKLLLDLAREAGATVREATPVEAITRLASGDVTVQAGGQAHHARVLLDCSGHGTIVGRHLGTRQPFTDPNLQKVAYFQHFDNVWHHPGAEAGHPGIIMCKEGWFWLIGLREGKTSVGFVTRPSFVRELKVPANQLLRWAIARCPVVRQRMAHARGTADNMVLADFSYRCRPYAGPGHYLVGDAAAFLDPIFSTGVTLAMISAHHCAGLVHQQLDGRLTEAQAQRAHIRFIESSTRPFWRLITSYYHHSFRELFMNGSGPLSVHKAVISLLAGQVFPQPVWALRWRLELFLAFMHLQKRFPLVPRRPEHSLLQSDAHDWWPTNHPTPTIHTHTPEPALAAP
jgi:flavin-dependent dehydrogenase